MSQWTLRTKHFSTVYVNICCITLQSVFYEQSPSGFKLPKVLSDRSNLRPKKSEKSTLILIAIGNFELGDHRWSPTFRNAGSAFSLRSFRSLSFYANGDTLCTHKPRTDLQIFVHFTRFTKKTSKHCIIYISLFKVVLNAHLYFRR